MATQLTLEQIAELAGVSRSTVSRVVNDQPNVRERVREQVLQVIRDTGYQPHAAARSLVTRRTRIIALVIPEAVTTLFATPFFAYFMSGVTETCNAHRYHLMLSLSSAATGQREMYQRVVRSGHVDGVIVASTRIDDPIIPMFLRDDVPFVHVGRHSDEQVNYVDVDNLAASRMAVEHLIRLGHQRIATITGPLNMVSGEDRLKGYAQALKAHRMAMDESLVVEGDYTEGSGKAVMQQLLLLKPTPTAVFAASDAMAVGALKALREADLSVPHDVALVGYDDIPLASAVEPALTTVRQPMERLGSLAADLLLSRLENSQGEAAPANRIILPGQLVVRDSCGALR